MSLRVFSEIGRLRRVLVHRPGREVDWMVPQLMEHLLFDDILDGEGARREHDAFTEILRRLEVEVLEARDLLEESLEKDEAREEILVGLERSADLSERVIERLADLAPRELAGALLVGLRSTGGKRSRGGHFFDLLPVPNYFFQRDPQIVVGDRVVVSSMATEAREREPLLSQVVFGHHPEIRGAKATLEIHRPPHEQPDVGPAFPFPTLEGGDVIVLDRHVLLVGISARTNRRGVESLAEHLRRGESSFRFLLAVELPPRRAFMHLDTVFTVVDHGLCLGYAPVIEAGGPEAARVYRVDLDRDELSFTVGGSLLEALREVGLELEMIPCGGSEDAIDQQREQWTDGANAFAVAPGTVFLYHRNRRTVAELGRRGFRVVTEAEALRSSDLSPGEERIVITFSGRELSRARGGPRCMTMPLVRDLLD